MSTRRAARDPRLAEGILTPAARRRLAGAGRRTAVGSVVLLAGLLMRHPSPAHAQPALPGAPVTPVRQAEDIELIVTVQTNGVQRGEFTILRKQGGDFWLRAEDLGQLRLEPLPAARRVTGAQTYYSVQALGASSAVFTEADLSLVVRFPSERLAGTSIDLASPPPAAIVTEPRSSLILSYRLSSASAAGQPTQVNLDTDLGVRIGPVLLRQATRLSPAGTQQGVTRGVTQIVWDDRPRARRAIVGDVLSTAGPYGSAVTGAGLMLAKQYDMTPDVIKQPTATIRASTALPAEVEVSVDGNPIYRGNVGPGPITLDNLLLYGGSRNVRVTITDITGHREVIDQPFLFTDSVLAKGLHDYAYFVGRRSELDIDNRWRYRELAWQGFHRYGVTDSLTVGAGGEGNGDFTSGGAGLTLRSDTLGLVSLDLLGSHDRASSTLAGGWSARYSYVVPEGSLLVGRRQFQQGFRSFLTSPTTPYIRSETRVAASTSLWKATVVADWVRSEDALEHRDIAAMRLSTNIGPRTTLSAEVQGTRINGGHRDWGAYVFLRMELDDQRWVGGNLRTERGSRAIDLETGRTLLQGEGVGYRIGSTTTTGAAGSDSTVFAGANWNLRPAALEFFGMTPLQGGNGYAEVAVSGAIVGVDGYWGLTRQVNDSFALARLGVPQAGVEVLLNNQVQGVTDDRGVLFVPNVGAFGRQDLSINDKQVGMQYNLAERRKVIAPAYRSGTVVDFGGKKLRAVAGMAWRVTDGRREPIASRAWTLEGPAGTLKIETSNTGDFYLDDAPPGSYAGKLEAVRRILSCRLTVPDFAEAVLELKEGIVCE